MKHVNLLLIVLVLVLAGCTNALPTDTESVNSVKAVSTSVEVTQDIPMSEPLIADLSEASSITYSLYKLETLIDLKKDKMIQDFFINSVAPSLQDEQFFYPLGGGEWAYTYCTQVVRDISSNKSIELVSKGVIGLSADESMKIKWRDVFEKNNRLTLLLPWDTGEHLTAQAGGSSVCLDGESVAVRDKLCVGAPLRDNQYFRISNDKENMSPYYYFGQMDITFPTPHYALFRYLDRLTDFKYQKLYASAFAFVGLYYDENGILHTDILNNEGETLRTEAADLSSEYPEVKNKIEYDGLNIAKDEATGLYYYANAAGEAVCEPVFKDCTNIKDGTSIVQIRDIRFMLVVRGID